MAQTNSVFISTSTDSVTGSEYVDKFIGFRYRDNELVEIENK